VAVSAALACTVAGIGMRPRFELVNIAMVYLLAVVLVAQHYSRGPAILATVLSVAAFDLLFVPPQGTFSVEDMQYLVTFAIMLAVGLVISRLAENVRLQAEAQARLEADAQTERVRSTLLASISHDLRTPLAVMSGASSSLAERGEQLTPQERQALARSVYEQAREMSERVAKLLQMTRLETGGIRLDRDWGSIAEIAGTSLSRLRERLTRHRVVLELPDGLPLVRVDAPLIDQALTNLLENAVRFSPPSGEIVVTAARWQNVVRVSVSDQGPGVPTQDRERVFEAFYRRDAGVGRAGSGLGLAIVRAIAEAHGGSARVAPAEGATVRLWLPASQRHLSCASYGGSRPSIEEAT